MISQVFYFPEYRLFGSGVRRQAFIANRQPPVYIVKTFDQDGHKYKPLTDLRYLGSIFYLVD